MALPPQDLVCPQPGTCPVPPGIEELDLGVRVLRAGTEVHRCYDVVRGYDTGNAGYGDTRFQPFDAQDGTRVPTLYVAETEAAALLETVFHTVHHDADRHVYQSSLLRRALVRLSAPLDLQLVDLRDEELRRLGVPRGGLVATSAEHYPCTRRVAAALHGRAVGGVLPQGLLWHSRQAELAEGPAAEVGVVFGDRAPVGEGAWSLSRPGVRTLFDGAGRELVERVAEELGAVVVLD